jgi:hypothetical protein
MRHRRLNIKFSPAQDVASTLKIEDAGKGGNGGTLTLENVYSLKAQGIKLIVNASQPTAGGNATFKAGCEYGHELLTLSATHDTKGKKTEVAATTGAASCNFWAGLKATFTGGALKKSDSQAMVAYTGPYHVTALSSLDFSKREISVFGQVNSNFSVAASHSVAPGKESSPPVTVHKLGFVNSINSDSSYRCVVSSKGDVALNYKQKLTAGTSLCLGTKLDLASLTAPAAITAALSINL